MLSGMGGTADPPRLLAGTIMRVDNGTSVTVWERTTAINSYTFSLATLEGAGGTFTTLAFERYTVTSDGLYLKIHCYRDNYANGTGVGDNIGGVRLDGVQDTRAGCGPPSS